MSYNIHETKKTLHVNGNEMAKYTHTAVTLHRHDPHAEPNKKDKKKLQRTKFYTERKDGFARKPSVATRGRFSVTRKNGSFFLTGINNRGRENGVSVAQI